MSQKSSYAKENTLLQIENEELRKRVKQLEAQVIELRGTKNISHRFACPAHLLYSQSPEIDAKTVNLPHNGM